MNNLKTNPFFKIAVGIVTLFCLISIISLQLEYNLLTEERDKLLAQKEMNAEAIDELEDTLATPFDEEYIIKIAREKLNLRLPEEIVFYSDITE